MNQEMRQWTIDTASVGTRVDLFLTHELGISRATVQRAIKAGNVYLNERPVKPHTALRRGDHVKYFFVIEEQSEQRASQDIPVPTILKVEPSYLIIDKPAHLMVHGAEGKQERTLSDWVVDQYPEIRAVGELTRPGIVHRLDRDASGVMVVPRTQDMYLHLSDQFRTRVVQKHYLALVQGVLDQDEGELRFSIARSTRKKRMAARPASAEGKQAITLFTVRERFHTATLLDLRILTGRTHQIRAHLHAFGAPVVGDTVYRLRHAKHTYAPLDRLFLHARSLSFTTMDGTWVEYESPLPDVLTNYLKGLRRVG